jgi:hypothetical protein
MMPLGLNANAASIASGMQHLLRQVITLIGSVLLTS